MKGSSAVVSSITTEGPAHAELGPLNVLLITIDTLRADALGTYGQPRPTSPHLDRIARDGVVFEHCLTAAPNTLPSHATILTGKYPYSHGVRSNVGYLLPSANVTLAERLSEAGYVTAAEIAAPVIGRQTRIDQGFQHWRDTLTPGVVLKTTRVETPEGFKKLELQERDAADITKRGVELLRRHRMQPFFLWLHYFDPHEVYVPPPAHANAIPDSYYHAEVRFADEQVGRVLRELERLGLRERTLVVVTSDHGEGLGQHEEKTHTFLVYDTTMRVPLIVWGPREILAGSRVTGVVRTADIAPTILDFIGLPPIEGASGASLHGLATGARTSVPTTAYGESLELHLTFGADILRFERQGRWKYIHKPVPELFDLVADPRELENLAARHPERVEEMKTRLQSRLAAAASQEGAVVALDGEQRAALSALGYLGGEAGRAIEDEVATLELQGRDALEILPDVQTFGDAWAAAREMKEYEVGARLFTELRERYPDSAPVLRGLAVAWISMGREEEALPLLERVTTLEPCAQGARLELSSIYAARRSYTQQRKVLEEGLEACPELSAVKNDLAYLLATCPEEAVRDGARAVRLASEIIAEMRYPPPSYLDTLAVAYAEAGEFERAIATGRRALTIARAQRLSPAILSALDEHQKRFEARKPVRDL